MKKVVTAEQMGEIDRLSTVEFGVPSIELMENAAKAVFEVVRDELGGSVAGKRCVVLCGKGNNGGDGAAVARLLMKAGADVNAYLLGRVEETRGDARINFDRYISECGAVAGEVEIESAGDIDGIWKQVAALGERVDVIVDAVFGTGLDRPVEGIYRHFLEAALEYAAKVSRSPLLVSVDLPSGVDSDKAEPIGFNFKPDLTVTFTSPKIANVMPPAVNEQGRLFVKDIGSPDELIKRTGSKNYLAERKDAAGWLSSTSFSTSSYKNKRGSVVIAAGSKAYQGAAVLASNGAMRSGAGIVTTVVPHSAFASVSERVLPEVMVRGSSETDSGTFKESAYGEMSDLLEGADAVLVGCGLSNEAETKDFVERVVATRNTPVVVDADGLNALSPLKRGGSGAPQLILTPHEGEFRRLTGHDGPMRPNDRIDRIREFATAYRVVCVLKGERSLIAAPDGRVVVNPTGNAGLGKAGNGDNLAGIITGFVAQTVAAQDEASLDRFENDIFLAVVAAVYLSGLAGDIAAKRFGKRVMTASDVRDCLAEAFSRASEKGSE